MRTRRTYSGVQFGARTLSGAAFFSHAWKDDAKFCRAVDFTLQRIAKANIDYDQGTIQCSIDFAIMDGLGYLSTENYNCAMTYLFTIKCWTYSNFIENVALDAKYYFDIIHNRAAAPRKLTRLLRYCYALDVGSVVGMELIGLAGYPLTRVDCKYQVIMNTMRGQSIYAIDQIIQNVGLDSII